MAKPKQAPPRGVLSVRIRADLLAQLPAGSDRAKLVEYALIMSGVVSDAGVTHAPK